MVLLMTGKRSAAQRGDALLYHSNHGSQYVPIRCSERLADAGVELLVERWGDSYDNVLAETINGSKKTELIYHRAP